MSSINGTTTKHILLTIDVEDWFQVENFKPWIPFETWDHCESRVERNVRQLLDLFDEIDVRGNKTDGRNQNSDFRKLKKEGEKFLQNPDNPVRKNKNKIKATFFVLGWIAKKLPHLAREIRTRGHEIASHGCDHKLPNQLSQKALMQDLTDSRSRLEDIIGTPVLGYRAPSFAINDKILKSIGDCGYQYDSSYNSFSIHGRYGKISLNGAGKYGIARRISQNFCELPVSNLMINQWVLPWGGGAYFRLIPLNLFNLGIKSILLKEGAYLFYIHPWELDCGQPRVREASTNYKFRHYSNLSKTHDRLKQLIKNFNNCTFISCTEYLNVGA